MGVCPPGRTYCGRCNRAYSEVDSLQLQKKIHICVVPNHSQIMLPVLQMASIKRSLLPDQTILMTRYGQQCRKTNDFLLVKVYDTQERTRCRIVIEPLWKFPQNIIEIPAKEMSNRSFQEKLQWFRLHIQRHRISWKFGKQQLKVDRHNLLMTTNVGLKDINLHKQLKIRFTDESVEDAGGLLREWMHLTMKEIFDREKNGNLLLCNTNEVAYKFHQDQNPIQKQVGIQTFKTMGLIIGKALFERIPLNCFLNRTIWRLICNKPVHFEDVQSYDSQLFKNWQLLLKDPKIEEWDLFFYEIDKDQHNFPIMRQLVPGGAKIKVNTQNKQLYLRHLIKYICVSKCETYIEVLRQNIYKTIPVDYLEIFEPLELEMMLNGQTQIDVKDWKKYTTYKGYKETDQIIIWFWKIVFNLNQQSLSNLLHYTTGSTRVPVRGFKYLESNRNQICCFQIEKITYNQYNPYPQSHTCFNRLSLPAYSSNQELKKNLEEIIKYQLNHFGLD